MNVECLLATPYVTPLFFNLDSMAAKPRVSEGSKDHVPPKGPCAIWYMQVSSSQILQHENSSVLLNYLLGDTNNDICIEY